MRILYGIQGTGNGHISRALEVLPYLKKKASVDILISGRQSELVLPYDIKYQMHGLGFVFGKNGGIDLIGTYKKSRLRKFYNEVKTMDLSQYDVVISDFEPITAWASMLQNKYCVGLSNQASLLAPNVPKAKGEDFVGRFIIRNYAPCQNYVGLSYKAYDKNVFTPIIRESIQNKTTSVSRGNYLVYLPAFSDKKIAKHLGSFENVNWEVYSKSAREEYSIGNIVFKKLNGQQFEDSLARCEGIITAAGFGTTTEALFLGKKLLVVPQKNQYEQACNAVSLKDIGVTVLKSLKQKNHDVIQNWIDNGEAIQMDYPALTEQIVERVLSNLKKEIDPYTDYLTQSQYNLELA